MKQKWNIVKNMFPNSNNPLSSLRTANTCLWQEIIIRGTRDSAKPSTWLIHYALCSTSIWNLISNSPGWERILSFSLRLLVRIHVFLGLIRPRPTSVSRQIAFSLSLENDDNPETEPSNDPTSHLHASSKLPPTILDLVPILSPCFDPWLKLRRP